MVNASESYLIEIKYLHVGTADSSSFIVIIDSGVSCLFNVLLNKHDTHIEDTGHIFLIIIKRIYTGAGHIIRILSNILIF